MAQITCYHCHTAWDFDPPLGRGEECASCHRDAKICLNCRFYDPQAHRECREPQAGWVREKDRANFCSYFSPIHEQEGASPSAKDAELKTKLEDLFKK